MNFCKIRQAFLTLIAVFVIGFNASALENVQFVMEPDAKAFSLYLNSQVKKAVAISIQDEFGIILWEENFQAEGNVTKKYNLDQLPDGNYFAHVSDQMKKIIQPLTIQQGGININYEDRMVNYKPMIIQNKHLLDINWFTAGEDVSIELTNQEGDKVIEQSLNEVLSLHKRYNLAQLPSGIYTLRLGTNKAHYYQKVICP